MQEIWHLASKRIIIMNMVITKITSSMFEKVHISHISLIIGMGQGRSQQFKILAGNRIIWIIKSYNKQVQWQACLAELHRKHHERTFTEKITFAKRKFPL